MHILFLTIIASLVALGGAEEGVDNEVEIGDSGATLKNPLPSRSFCGVTGYITEYTYPPGRQHPYPLNARSQYAPSVEKCRDLCVRAYSHDRSLTFSYTLPSCLSFGFDAIQSICYYHGKKITSVIPSSNRSLVLYNLNCFDIPPTCPPMLGQNLFDNYGFDLSAHHIAPWKGEFYHRHIAHSGNKSPTSLQCKGYICRLKRNWKSCPGYVYKISFDYKTIKFGSHNRATVFWAHRSFLLNSTIYELTVETSDKWKTVTAVTTIESQYNFAVYELDFDERSADPPILIDNVKLTPIASLLDSTNTPNIVINGGFESGKVSPWKASSDDVRSLNVSVGSPGIHSDYALNMSFVPEVFDPPYEGGVTMDLGQALPSLGNRSSAHYRFSIDYRIHWPGRRPGPNILFRLYLTNHHPSNSMNIDRYSLLSNQGRMQGAFTRLYGWDRLQLELGVSSSKVKKKSRIPGYILFDNIIIQEINITGSELN